MQTPFFIVQAAVSAFFADRKFSACGTQSCLPSSCWLL
jgi:hypothetical protein